jgi:hypothetical protein
VEQATIAPPARSDRDVEIDEQTARLELVVMAVARLSTAGLSTTGAPGGGRRLDVGFFEPTAHRVRRRATADGRGITPPSSTRCKGRQRRAAG